MWKCPPSRVLVPVDFGEASGQALRVGALVAARTGGQLRMLHAEAIEVPPYFTREQLATIERERRAARARAEEFLEDFASRQGVAAASSTIVELAPTSAVLAAGRDADLIVMGTHGRRGPSRWWLGSVAERVVHESRTPVLVVRADLGGLGPERVFERPLVVSPSGEPGDAHRLAVGLARLFDGEVVEGVARCQADLARARQATLVVVSKSSFVSPGPSGPPEQWLRSCTLPMLFV